MVGNKVTFIGRLVRDVELRETGDTFVANFTLAKNRPNRNNADAEEVADFVNFVAFSKMARTIADYVKKGDRLAVEGHISQNTYESNKYHDDSGNSAKITRTEIIVETIEFLEKKGEKTNSVSHNTDNRNQQAEEDTTEELPF